jgi:phage tail tube protein FII
MKEIWNIIQDSRFLDNGVVIEDVQTAELPNMEFATTEIKGSGMAGAVSMPDYSMLNAMSASLNHNNGRNCHLLRTPGKHKMEFRAVSQVMDVENSEVKQALDKFRIDGLYTSDTGGTIERSNPRSSTDSFSVLRYEHERNGEILTLIDIPRGIIKINGVDYSAAGKSLLD